MPKPKKPQKRILVIAEKPIQGREIAGAILDQYPAPRALPQGGVIGALGEDEVLVSWAEGHLMEMVKPDDIRPEWGSPWRPEVLPISPDGYQIPKRPLSGSESRLNTIAAWMYEAREVVNACDAGTEGELIFDEICKFACRDQDADKGQVLFTRMWITDTRPEALKKAYVGRSRSNLMKSKHQREAAYARAEADWIFGFNCTRYATLGLHREDLPLLVIGRVQTPTLGEVVAIDLAIATFEPDPFEIVPLTFRGDNGASFRARLVAFPDIRHGNVDYHFHPGPEVRDIRQELLMTKEIPWKITDLSEPREEYAPPPFSLIDLQRSAFNIMQWPAAKTLSVAQSLYAREKAITYPRTDSSKVPLGMRRQVEAVREKLYYGWALERFPDLKGAQLGTESAHWEEGAIEHYAILPTGVVPQAWDREDQMRDEYRLWQIIVVRTILAWLPSARIAAVKRLMMRPWGKETAIRAFVEAEPVDDPGWLWWEEKMFNTRGYGKPLAERMREVALPDAGVFAKMDMISITQGATSPPKHHDESTLLGWMQRHNLGTAATRAQVIEDLINYGYIVRHENGQIRCSLSGAKMVALLESRVGDELTGEGYARQTEEFVERIAGMARERPSRERMWDSVVSKVRSVGARLIQQPAEVDEAFCPRTGHKAFLHQSGKYYVFPGFKDARFWLTISGRKMKVSEYASILHGGERGGGPFEGFTSQAGNKFDAYLVWRPRKKRAEFRFKR